MTIYYFRTSLFHLLNGYANKKSIGNQYVIDKKEPFF